MSQAFNCPNCSAPLDYNGQDLTVRCPYCNSSVIVPDNLRSGPPVTPRPSSLPVVGMDALTSQAMQLKEVVRLIRSGNKIQAIKVYQETFKVGLAEAKLAVDTLAAGNPILLPGSTGVVTTPSLYSSASTSSTSTDLEGHIAQLLRTGNKIEAIKAYREATNLGLKEAKDAVEYYERGFPLRVPSATSIPYVGTPAATPTFTSSTSSPTYTATTSGTYSNTQPKSSFIGTWLGWSFGAFWVGFIVAMGSLFVFPGLLRLAAPVFCPSDYVDAYGQRVFNYYSDGVSIDGAGILKCVSPEGNTTVPHPMAVFAFMFITPWVLGIGIALWLAIFRNMMVLGCLFAVGETAFILVGAIMLNYNIPAPSSQTIPMFLFGADEEHVTTTTITTTTSSITLTETFIFQATATPSFAPLVQSIGGEEGTGPSQFNDTRTIAVDDDGNIFVADYSDGRIQKFDSEGVFASIFDIEDDNVYITGMAAGDDTLYVVYGGELHRLDSETGEVLEPFPTSDDFRSYSDAVVAPSGNIVVASSDYIVVYAPDGTEVLVLENWGEGLSSQGFTRIDVDNLAVDRSDNIYIADSSENQVFKFSPEGQFMDRIGVDGDGPGEFDGLYGLAVDSSNRIYGLDYDGVQVLNARGAFLGLIEIESLGYDLAVHDDKLYVMDRNANKILIYQQPVRE